MKTQEQALAYVKTKCAATCEPTLSDEVLTDILNDNAYASLWVANTAYAEGTRIVPATPNGRYYKCAVAGTSGAVSPHWIGRRVPDNDVVWVDDGPAFAELYDLKGAIHDAWQQKASDSACEINFSGGNSRFEREAIHLHCVAQAKRYKKTRAMG